jgi:hypothetical protein
MSFNITEISSLLFGPCSAFDFALQQHNLIILLVSTELSKDLILSCDMHHKPYPYLLLKVSYNPLILPCAV